MKNKTVVFTLFLALAALAAPTGAAAKDEYTGRYVSEGDDQASINISYLEDNAKAMGLLNYRDKKDKKRFCTFEFHATVKDGRVYSRSETAPGCTLNVTFIDKAVMLRIDNKCMETFCKGGAVIPGGEYKKVSNTPRMR